MPTQFPLGLDDFNNPTGASSLSDPAVLHSEQHSNINDAVEAIQRKIGITNSADTASLTNRVNALLIASGAYATTAQLNAAINTALSTYPNISSSGAVDGAVLIYNQSTQEFVASKNLDNQTINGGHY